MVNVRAFLETLGVFISKHKVILQIVLIPLIAAIPLCVVRNNVSFDYLDLKKTFIKDKSPLTRKNFG